MKRLFVLLLLISSPVMAQSIFSAPPRIEHLPNGLTVILIPSQSPGIVAYYTLVRVGSRDEVEAGHTGFAHLFEHMMFRGTERFPASAYEERFQELGADHNAFTTSDFTLYTTVAPSSGLAAIVEVEADRFQHLRYEEDAFRTETGAVRGEYDTSVSDPMQRMMEELASIAFTRHTYGHTTIGYLRDIDAMPGYYEYSQRFFQRFYTPDNATVLVAGDFDAAQVMQLVQRNYGSWRGRRDQPRIPVEPQPTAGARRDLDWPSPISPRIMIGYRGPAFIAGRTAAEQNAALRQTAALQVVHGLALSEPSPLYQRLVVDERRCLELGSWTNDFSRDPGLFTILATLGDGQSEDAIIDAIQTELASIASGAAASRVDAVKSHIRYAMISGPETPSDLVELAAFFVAVGGDVSWLDRYLEAVSAVTAEEVARAAAQYLVPARRFVITLRHREAQ